MIGWRKLTAWGLVFVLVAVATWLQRDVPSNAKSLLEAATLFFFGANAIGKVSSAVAKKPETS